VIENTLQTYIIKRINNNIRKVIVGEPQLIIYYFISAIEKNKFNVSFPKINNISFAQINFDLITYQFRK